MNPAPENIVETANRYVYQSGFYFDEVICELANMLRLYNLAVTVNTQRLLLGLFG